MTTGFAAFAYVLSVLVLISESQHGGAAAAAAGIQATATPLFPYLPRGQKSDDFQVLLRVEAPAEEPAARRTAGAVAVVLDVDEDKIGYVMNAAGHVTKASSGIGVFVRSSAYGAGWVEVAGLLDARAEGRLGDGENRPVDDGLAAAHSYLRGKAGAGCIILVTDTADAAPIPYNRDVPVHILDVGVDSGALLPLHSTFIDEKGGTHSFVETTKNEGARTVDLASALAVLVAGLGEVVAPKKTRVTLGAKAQGVTVRRVRRGGVQVPLAEDNDSFDIDVLYAGEVKNFIVHLDVPLAFTPSKKCAEKQLLLEYAVAGYVKKLYITRPQDNVYPLLMPMPMPTVVHHIVEFELLEVVHGLILAYENANQLMENLVYQWGVLVNKHRFEVGWDLAGLQAEIDEIVSRLNNHDVSYIFSWWSGYQAQRPTVLGSWENTLTVFVHSTVIRRWTKVVVTVNVNVEIDGNGRCKSATRCEAPENDLFVEGPQGTFALNHVYNNIHLLKINTVFKELFQAGCKADEASALRSTPPRVIRQAAHWMQLWTYLLPEDQWEPMVTGCNRLLTVIHDFFFQATG